MAIEKFTFYANTIKEINWITKHLKKLPKETLKSLESLESTEDIGIDSPVSVKNLIRVYPINGEIIGFKGPKGSKDYSHETRFTYKKIEYSVFKQPPRWL